MIRPGGRPRDDARVCPGAGIPQIMWPVTITGYSPDLTVPSLSRADVPS
jgi:hypothetical protein